MSNLLITLEGLPEAVQRIADAIDLAFPETIAWEVSAEHSGNNAIKIDGYEIPTMMPWKLERSAA